MSNNILFAGDFHGNLPHVKHVIAAAKKTEANKIVQLGDFSFVWNGTDRLKKLQDELPPSMDLYFLDGNHENFDLLEALGATQDADNFVQLAPNIFYLPRGFAWEWDGIRFMSIGGAYSVDKHSRTQGSSWWPQETIKFEDYERAIQKGPVDVLLSHDCPELPLALSEYLQGEGILGTGSFEADVLSQSNRMVLAHIAAQIHPKLILHGHYHHRYNGMWHEATVVGLDCDNTGQRSWVVMNTETMLQEASDLHFELENARLNDKTV